MYYSDVGSCCFSPKNKLRERRPCDVKIKKRLFFGILICIFCGSLISQHISFLSQNMVSYAATNTEPETETTKQPITDTLKNQTKKVEETVKKGTGDSIYSENLEQKKNNVGNTYYRVHSSLKNILPLVFVGCIVFGILIIVFSRKNKGLRQRVFLKFCVFIPFIFLLLVYGMPYFTILTKIPASYINGNHSVKFDVVQDVSSPQEIVLRYENVLERIAAAAESKQISAEAEAYQVLDGYSHLNILLKKHLFVIILACEASGCCVIFLCRRKVSTVKWAKINLCIVLPCLVLVVVYCIPAIQKVFSF